MPQDIPLEASETLAFTPPSLAGLDAPPTLTLRAATWREKRALRKLGAAEGVQRHDIADLRAEVRNGLREQWGEDGYAKHMPLIEAYWDADDAFQAEVRQWTEESPNPEGRADNPAPKWTYDPELEAGIIDLLNRLEKEHRPLARMKADNADYSELMIPLMVAVTVKDWIGLSTKRQIEDGYLALGCAVALVDELIALATANDIQGALPFLELGDACSRRLYLRDDTVGNSELPSPSPTPPEVSTTAALDPGPSPASKSPRASRRSSTKTRAVA